MGKYGKYIVICLFLLLFLTGCGLKTVDQLYCLPKRSEAYNNLQTAIDEAMDGLSFSAPIYGDNRQNVQAADLDGDGVDEYLLFAKDNSEKPLKVLIFAQLASGYVLMDTIEGYGLAFDFVEYAQMDDRPGMEIILGRQVSDQVARAVSVYRFTSGFARQLMSTGYSRLTTCDLDQDGRREIFLLNYGVAENGKGLVTLYRYEDGEMQRSTEKTLSESANRFERFTTGTLQDGTQAVFVTCEKDDHTLTTDVFRMEDMQIQTVASGIMVHQMMGYNVYPSDVDGDGIMELPRQILIPNSGESRQYLLQWYAIDHHGTETVKHHTFHHYAEGWFVTVEDAWVNDMTVVCAEDNTTFYRVNGSQKIKLVTIRALTNADREDQAKQDGRIILYKGDAVIYTAELFQGAEDLGITQEYLRENFFPIRAELIEED